jgi:dTMP kinase
MFVTFEGADGAGKTTQIALAAEHLRRQGRRVTTTREPGGTSIGDRIRQILHDVAHREMTARAEILLYAASRAQLVEEVIVPRLAQGEIVLCDRYVDSTYAYQGYGRGLDFDVLRRITHFATGGLEPDLTIYLDLPAEVGLRRKATGTEELNRMDQQQLDFYERVQAGYRELARSEPARWWVIDASPPVEVVSQQICRRLEQSLL